MTDNSREPAGALAGMHTHDTLGGLFGLQYHAKDARA
jgi:hypothetical protein